LFLVTKLSKEVNIISIAKENSIKLKVKTMGNATQKRSNYHEKPNNITRPETLYKLKMLVTIKPTTQEAMSTKSIAFSSE
jgi:hypothetical protein